MLNKLKSIPKFFKEVMEELKKVNWSTRHELKGTLVVVVSAVALLTIYFFFIDLGLSKLIQNLLRG